MSTPAFTDRLWGRSEAIDRIYLVVYLSKSGLDQYDLDEPQRKATERVDINGDRTY